MTWPNSVATTRPLPGLPSTFPGVPANDNWRMPRFNAVPPRAANDNMPRRPGGLRLPGVRLPIPALWIGATALHLLYEWYTASEWTDFGPWEKVANCAISVPSHWLISGGDPTAPLINSTNNCLGNQASGLAVPLPVTGTPAANQRTLIMYEYTHDQFGQPRYRLSEMYGRPAGSPNVYPQLKPGRSFALPRAMPQPYPGFFPPLLNPPFAPPPPVRPGFYQGPKQIMGEWPDSGYRAPQTQMEQRSTYLPSRRPPSRTKERKVRAKDYAIGRTIEWLVSQSTEGLDFQRALFEALPWWRKIALYNAARQLETRYADGRIVAGRLHYRDLTPIEKAQAIYDYIDEIDTAKAVENAVKMQLTDMFWAEIGQRMGRYQTGPWDDHGFDGPPKPEPEWEWYIPDIAPDNTHNHWTYETLVNKRLTQQEAQRIHNRFDQFRSAPYQERKYR